jgi:hypothetical protein
MPSNIASSLGLSVLSSVGAAKAVGQAIDVVVVWPVSSNGSIFSVNARDVDGHVRQRNAFAKKRRTLVAAPIFHLLARTALIKKIG